jgi:predicted acetyltransferase
MTDLQMSFLPVAEITPELDRRIEALDHLAFSGEAHTDPEFASIEWGSPDWMSLGFMNEELVTQFSLLKREILVGGQPVSVAGVGGVATHPQWLRRGLASTLLRAAESFMRDEIRVPFGLLICADETQPVYARCGWRTVAKSLLFVQNNLRRRLETCVMILPLADQPWPGGEIDLCGLPW